MAKPRIWNESGYTSGAKFSKKKEEEKKKTTVDRRAQIADKHKGETYRNVNGKGTWQKKKEVVSTSTTYNPTNYKNDVSRAQKESEMELRGMYHNRTANDSSFASSKEGKNIKKTADEYKNTRKETYGKTHYYQNEKDEAEEKTLSTDSSLNRYRGSAEYYKRQNERNNKSFDEWTKKAGNVQFSDPTRAKELGKKMNPLRQGDYGLDESTLEYFDLLWGDSNSRELAREGTNIVQNSKNIEADFNKNAAAYQKAALKSNQNISGKFSKAADDVQKQIDDIQSGKIKVDDPSQQIQALKEKKARYEQQSRDYKGFADYDDYVTTNVIEMNDDPNKQATIEKGRQKDTLLLDKNNLNFMDVAKGMMVSGDEDIIKAAALSMTPEEEETYLWIVGNKDQQAGFEFLKQIYENGRTDKDGNTFGGLGQRFANLANNAIDDPVFSNVQAFAAGAQNSIFGLRDFGERIGAGFANVDAPVHVEGLMNKVYQDNVQTGRVNKVFGDIIYNIGNMMPAIAVSVATAGVASPAVAGAISASVTGASSFGNTYQQARREGFDSESATLYATINGISEAALQYALTGVGQMAGGFTTDALATVASEAVKDAVKNPVAKYVLSTIVKQSINSLGEFTEEYLQEVLDPVFRNWALGEANEFQPFSQEALYAGLLGALSAGVMNSVEVAGDVVRINVNGSMYNRTTIGQLMSDSLNLPPTITARQTAEYYQQNNKAKDGSIKLSNMEAGLLSMQQAQGEMMINQIDEALMDIGLSWNGLSDETRAALVDPKNADFFAEMYGLNINSNMSPNEIANVIKNKITSNEVENGIFRMENAQENGVEFENNRTVFEKIQDKLGLTVMFKNFDNANEHGRLVGDRLIINSRYANTDEAVTTTLVHEITHASELSKHYEALKNAVLKIMESRDADFDIEEAIKEKIADYEADNKNLTREGALAEIVAEFSENTFFNNADSLIEFLSENKSLGQRILSWFKERIKSAAPKTSEERMLNKALNNFKLALNEISETDAFSRLLYQDAVSAGGQASIKFNEKTKMGVVLLDRKIEAADIEGMSYLRSFVGKSLNSVPREAKFDPGEGKKLISAREAIAKRMFERLIGKKHIATYDAAEFDITKDENAERTDGSYVYSTEGKLFELDSRNQKDFNQDNFIDKKLALNAQADELLQASVPYDSDTDRSNSKHGDFSKKGFRYRLTLVSDGKSYFFVPLQIAIDKTGKQVLYAIDENRDIYEASIDEAKAFYNHKILPKPFRNGFNRGQASIKTDEKLAPKRPDDMDMRTAYIVEEIARRNVEIESLYETIENSSDPDEISNARYEIIKLDNEITSILSENELKTDLNQYHISDYLSDVEKFYRKQNEILNDKELLDYYKESVEENKAEAKPAKTTNETRYEKINNRNIRSYFVENNADAKALIDAEYAEIDRIQKKIDKLEQRIYKSGLSDDGKKNMFSRRAKPLRREAYIHRENIDNKLQQLYKSFDSYVDKRGYPPINTEQGWEDLGAKVVDKEVFGYTEIYQRDPETGIWNKKNVPLYSAKGVSFSESTATQSEKTKSAYKDAVAFTGHRPGSISRPETEIKADLRKEILSAIESGHKTFISGMAIGTDLWAAEVVAELKKQYNDIKLIGAVPFEGHTSKWTKEWKDRYNALLPQFDEIINVSESYNNNAYQTRNKWMVDNATDVIAVFNGKASGTKNTVDYATKQGKNVRTISPYGKSRGQASIKKSGEQTQKTFSHRDMIHTEKQSKKTSAKDMKESFARFSENFKRIFTDSMASFEAIDNQIAKLADPQIAALDQRLRGVRNGSIKVANRAEEIKNIKKRINDIKRAQVVTRYVYHTANSARGAIQAADFSIGADVTRQGAYQADITGREIWVDQKDINGNVVKDENGNVVRRKCRSLYDIWHDVQERTKEDPEYNEDFQDFLRIYDHMDRTKTGHPKLASDKNKPGTDPKKLKAMPQEEAQQLADELLAKHPEFEQLAREVWDYNHNLLKYLLDSGNISKQLYDKLLETHPHYIPADRDFDSVYGKGKYDLLAVRKDQGNNLSLPFLPIDQAMAAQTRRYMIAAKRNQMMNAVADAYDAHGKAIGNFVMGMTPDTSGMKLLADHELTIEEIENAFNPELDEYTNKKNTIVFYRNGQKYTMQVSDGIYEGYTGLSAGMGDFEKIFGAPTRAMGKFFRQFVTSYNPTFIATNFLKDFGDAIFYSQNTGLFLKNFGRAWKEITSNGQIWQLYKANGGFSSSFFEPESNIGKRRNPFQRYFLDKIEQMNVFVEQAPRLSEFMTTLEMEGFLDSKGRLKNENDVVAVNKNGEATTQKGRKLDIETLRKAMFAANDITVNFGRSGTLTKKLNRSLIPFLNASVQGFSKITRQFQQNGGKAWARLAAKCALLGVMPAVLNSLLYKDDDDFKHKKDWERDNNYLFKLPDGKWLAIPRGRFMSFFAGIGNRAVRAMNGDDVDWTSMGDIIETNIAPANPIENNILSPIIRFATNKTWYGSDIDSYDDMKKPAGERYDSSTSVIFKALGKALDVSPKRLQVLFEDYTGFIGDVVVPETNSKDDHFWDNMSQKFIKDPVYSNDYGTIFNALRDETSQLVDYEGETEVPSVQKLKLQYLNSQRQVVSDIYDQVEELQNSDKTEKEKDAMERVLMQSKNEVYALAVDNADKIEKTLEKYYKVDEDAPVSVQKRQAYYAYAQTMKDLFGTKEALKAFGLDDDEIKEVEGKGINLNDYYEFYKATHSGDKYFSADEDDKAQSYTKSEKKQILAKLDLDEKTKVKLYQEYIENDDISQRKSIQFAIGRGISFNDYIAADAKMKEIGEMENGEGVNKPLMKKEWIANNAKDEKQTVALYMAFVESADVERKNSIEYAVEHDVKASSFLKREIQRAGEEGDKSGETSSNYYYEDGMVYEDITEKYVSGSKLVKAVHNMLNSGYSDKEIEFFYQREYGSDDAFVWARQSGMDAKTYLQYRENTALVTADKDANGKSISGTKKKKIFDIINEMPISKREKLILFMRDYSLSKDQYREIFDYIDSLNLSRDEKLRLAEGLGFLVEDGKVYMKKAS